MGANPSGYSNWHAVCHLPTYIYSSNRLPLVYPESRLMKFNPIMTAISAIFATLGFYFLLQSPSLPGSFSTQHPSQSDSFPSPDRSQADSLPPASSSTHNPIFNATTGLNDSNPNVSPTREDVLQSARTIQLVAGGKMLYGKPLAWDSQQLVVMAKNGFMHYIPWHQQSSLSATQDHFVANSHQEMEIQLRQEFGSQFSVFRSTNFLVVQPSNNRKDWALKMQQFYGSAQTYFSIRQLPLRRPKFPLVAIVLPNRNSMLRYAQQNGDPVSGNFLAYYSIKSNRVILYDEPDSESLDIATVFHEALHQIAFNTGIHFRTATPPRWLAEGIATAFESPGMYDHLRSRERKDRINTVMLQHVKIYAKDETFASDIQSLIANDDLFEQDPTKAYALSWAIAFHHMETGPQQFMHFLKATNNRKPFDEHGHRDRLSDFSLLAQTGIQNYAEQLARFYRNEF